MLLTNYLPYVLFEHLTTHPLAYTQPVYVLFFYRQAFLHSVKQKDRLQI